MAHPAILDQPESGTIAKVSKFKTKLIQGNKGRKSFGNLLLTIMMQI
jgi:hypothetical protein